MFDFVKRFFQKRENAEFPSKYGIIKSTGIAKQNAINDDMNKVIEMHNPDGTIDEIEYTLEEARAIIEIDEIPLIEEDLDTKFDFEQESFFGEVKNKA